MVVLLTHRNQRRKKKREGFPLASRCVARGEKKKGAWRYLRTFRYGTGRKKGFYPNRCERRKERRGSLIDRKNFSSAEKRSAYCALELISIFLEVGGSPQERRGKGVFIPYFMGRRKGTLLLCRELHPVWGRGHDFHAAWCKRKKTKGVTI